MGEETSFSKWLDSYRASSQKTWLERNTLMTDLKEQAASDRLLFHSENKPHGFELRTPEYVVTIGLESMISFFLLVRYDGRSRRSSRGPICEGWFGTNLFPHEISLRRYRYHGGMMTTV